ncbi:MAG TPA: hypothetical protein VK671_05785 [Mucilaginibacter sp.]|jgi:hypothetical protein|nr:hypothetical protein [Mucilaginibacter sp.]
MEEDLKDIDLIDRYLNNELDEQQQRVFKDRYLNDPEFKKEVEVYQKIYEGVEKATRDSLKQRLEGYYNEYVDEDLSIEEDTKVVSINKWRRTTWVITGIAASLLLVAAGVWYYTLKNAGTNQQIASTRPANKIDSPNVKHDQYAGTKGNPSKDHTTKTGENKLPLPTGKGDQYGLEGGQKVSIIQVLQANYPQPLFYTFKDSLLSVYGDPQLGLIRLHIFKTGNQYYLWYDGDVYKLDPANSRTTLKKTGNSEDFGTKSPERIKVQVEPLQESATASAKFSVRAIQVNDNSYFFMKEKGKQVLELRGNFMPKKCFVIRLKKDNKQDLYLVNKSSVYLLDEKNTNPARLKELSGLISQEARLFIKRDAVSLPVYIRK